MTKPPVQHLGPETPAAPDGVFMCEESGLILEANQHFCEAIGYDLAEVLGQPLSSLMADDNPAADTIWPSLKAQGFWSGTLQLRNKKGLAQPGQLSVTGVCNHQGQVSAYVGIFRSAPGAGTPGQSSTADAQHGQADSLNAEKIRLEQEMAEFVRGLAHDLRAPLRAINGYAHLLAESEAHHPGQNHEQLLAGIQDNTEKAGLLIGEMVALSLLATSEIHGVPVELTAMVKELAADLSKRYPGSQVIVAPLPTVMGDVQLLKQAIWQLLDNACKFSSRVARPEVVVQSNASPEQRVTISIQDNGAGFDMRYADRLFRLFHRLHSQNEFPGLGTGLAKAKRIIERHGGAIWCRAEPGKGARFSFCLPAIQAINNCQT